jgi:hypothetical protein
MSWFTWSYIFPDKEIVCYILIKESKKTMNNLNEISKEKMEINKNKNNFCYLLIQKYKIKTNRNRSLKIKKNDFLHMKY